MRNRKLREKAVCLLMAAFMALSLLACSTAESGQTSLAETNPETGGQTIPAGTDSETAAMPEETTGQNGQNSFIDSATGLPKYFSFPSLAGLEGTEWNEAAIAKNAAARSEYQATQFVTSSGVTVQKVPDDPLLYNVAVLKAEERGCNACHDLSDALEMLPLSHPRLNNMYINDELSVEMCIVCHTFLGYYGVDLAESMHSLHMLSDSFKEIGGDCLSCHNIDNTTGEFQVWDRVKYDLFHGVTYLDADAVSEQVQISYTQDKLTELDEIFTYWENSNGSGVSDSVGFTREDGDNWEIAISGDVDHPGVVRWADFLEKYRSESITEVRTIACAVNGVGNGQIANLEITGIPMKLLLDEVGAHWDEGKVNTIRTVGEDGMAFPSAVMDSTLLVYAINGHEFEPGDPFYPVKLWLKNGAVGSYYINWPRTIEVTQMDAVDEIPYGPGLPDQVMFLDANGNGVVAVNSGILNARDGQVFEFGETVHIEGYTHSWVFQTTAVEYSFDLGQTWSRMDTSDSRVGNWIYWSLDFEPEQAGSYVLMVRGCDNMGNVQGESDLAPDVCTKFLINVQ